ncbi:MAG TPA: hypothetical protein VMZ90_14435, partial [Vicinamibacterales bacterium]|nr:hypothetical protein [Vicinamibacterales bacterium]
MNHSAKRTLPVLVLVFASAYAWVGAQAPAKKALGIEDYTRWKTISGQEISGDGAWVTYGVALTNTAPNETKPVLHLLNLATNQDVEVANGTGGTFSADSKWIAYQVDPTGGRGGGRGGRGGTGGPVGAAGVSGAAPPAVAPEVTTPPGQTPPATEPGAQAGRGSTATTPPARRV